MKKEYAFNPLEDVYGDSLDPVRIPTAEDRGRAFLAQVYPHLSDRRKSQIEQASLTPTGYKGRTSSKMAADREAMREHMSEKERLAESKKVYREKNLEMVRLQDRNYQRKKFGYSPRVAERATETIQ